MQEITIAVTGCTLDFETVRRMAEPLALRDNEFATLVAWNDADKGIHSPQCLKCEIKGEPAWEVYGRNHGGRLRISVNDETWVLIYS
ncbi:AF1514 family protein [Thermodesulfobacteriota bacterium B35]